MICRLVKVVLASLIFGLVFMPISIAFGSGIAILIALIGLAYIFEEK